MELSKADRTQIVNGIINFGYTDEFTAELFEVDVEVIRDTMKAAGYVKRGEVNETT